MSLESFLLSPPAAAVLIFAAVFAVDKWLSRYSHAPGNASHEADPFACGQRGVENYVSPDYSEFFPYAALFTLVHAMVLLVATAPAGESLLPAVFILAAFLMLYLVFRKVR
jgi:hypothetical protein